VASILVLDDDKRFSESLSALLESLGYEVRLAGSVAEAEELCSEDVPDLALVDLVLPGAEPDIFVQLLRTRRDDLSVVLMSGFFEGGKEVERMQRLCATNLFLAKPFDFDRLVALLRRQLGDPMALSDGSQEPKLDDDGRLDQTSLATVLMRAGQSEEGAIIDVRNQRGHHRFFIRSGCLRFWQSDQPGLNLPGLLGLNKTDIILADTIARHQNLPLLDTFKAQQLCTQEQAVRAWRMGALSLVQAGLLSPGRAVVREQGGWEDCLPDLELDLESMILHGIAQAHPHRINRYLAPRSNGLLLPGPNYDRLAAIHAKVFSGDLRARIDSSGTLSSDLLGRLWSDPRRRDKVYAELYALLVSGQILVLQAQDDAAPAAPSEGGFGVIQMSADHHHDSLEGIDAELVAIREEVRLLYNEQEGRDHYGALGVERNADNETVREAFRNRFAQYHTDRFRGMDLGSDLELLQRVLARWGQARDLLTDAEARLEYDLTIDRAAAGSSADVDALLAADGLVRNAEKALGSGRYKVAYGLMQQVLELRPNAEQYQFLHAFSAGMQGIEDAAAVYETMRDLNEKATVFGAERMLGQIALRDDQNDIARRHFKAAVAAQKDDHIALRELRRL
jgi:DNA-binding response OmpR family regulator